MKKGAFKTIVASEQVRAEYSALRNSLGTTDKGLMQAIWRIVTALPADELIDAIAACKKDEMLAATKAVTSEVHEDLIPTTAEDELIELQETDQAAHKADVQQAVG